MRPRPAHRATTAHLQAVYPFGSSAGLPRRGPVIGRDLLGGTFHFDPWELYRLGVLTNPNLVVIGQIGRGKSTFVKTFVWRQLAFGRQAWILDPKGEYGPLAAAAGVVPLRLAPGAALRLNPLDLPGSTGSDVAVRAASVARRAELVCSVLASSLRRMLLPPERTAVELATQAVIERTPRPTLPDLVGALLDPDPRLAASVRTDPAGLAADGRMVALELRRLVEGDLAGMFDGPTSDGIDLSMGLVVIDLSAVFASAALPLIMICASAWMQSVQDRRTLRLLVVDEAWAILRDLASARWLQSSFKLSRALGQANVAVVHRLSDLTASGADGSEQQRLAEGLLGDSETRVVFAQSSSEAGLTSDLLDLTLAERDLVVRLPRGVALWKVGSRSFLVEHVVGAPERPLVDTDGAMAVPPPP